MSEDLQTRSDSEPEEDSESSSDDEEEEKQSTKSLKRTVDHAESDEYASTSLHELFQHADSWEEAILEAETFVIRCGEFLETAKSEKEELSLNARLKRRKQRIHKKTPDALAMFDMKKNINLREKPASFVPDRLLWKYPEELPSLELHSRRNKTEGSTHDHCILKHSLECPRYEAGNDVGLCSMMDGVYAEGRVVKALPSLGLYRVDVQRTRDWQLPQGERVCSANMLVRARETTKKRKADG